MNAPLAQDRQSMTLQDRYTVERGWLYMTGTQALVRLPLQQRARDAAAGLNTGGYISGYRGSPLGRYDMELWAADDLLKANNVVFRSGVNEDLAATAIWGAQFVGTFPGATVDGVFGIWYGKVPGVDRSGDALRHANMTGTSALGGVLALAGDDHGIKSSTIANYSDQMFIALGMPLLYPSNAQELLDFGLHGIALSRLSGCWVGMKVVTDVVEGGGSIHVAPDSPKIVAPTDYTPPPGGLNARYFERGEAQEVRLYHHKLYAALAYARANGLNRITVNPPAARIGIVSAGKAWQDTLQAMATLGLDGARCEQLGIRVLKIGMTWPLDPEVLREFARGLACIVVVEEKRPVLEDQIRAILYGGPQAPAIIGKFAANYCFDAQRGPMVFPNAGETHPTMVMKTLIDVIVAEHPDCGLKPFELPPPLLAPTTPMRLPGFCSGCPHNRSTKLPEGSRALAGIGCHAMAMLMDPSTTTTISHMGAEGMMWLGQQPFTTERHVFANLGDGTYTHSGFLAVRQAVIAHVPMTYKILYNGFVSMTGGQPVEGNLSAAAILHELAAEGVLKMALVTDEPEKYQGVRLPEGVPVRPRDELEAVQREFRDYPDVSVIVYEQPCATERRRLRRRGKWDDPPKRAFINAALCEGCGDCGKVSNCMSIEPLETEFGRKRRINQHSCNKDYSCVEGFCPSFVTVHGGKPRGAKPADDAHTRRAAADASFGVDLPTPILPQPTGSFSVLIGGIGGTGVVTIGQTLAVAAHLEGWFSSNLDVTGLAQKYGAVLSHVKLARSPEALHATRIAAGEADTLIGCDLIVSAGDEAASKLRAGRSAGVVCTDLIPTADFARNPDWQIDSDALLARLRGLLGERGLLLEGQRLASALLGDAIAANMFLLGAAWQLGQIPLQQASIERAMTLNGVAVDMNKQAFLWGRRAAHDLPAVERCALAAAGTAQVIAFNPRKTESLADLVARRTAFLTEYQNASYAARYSALVDRVQKAESTAGLGQALSRAVARNHFKLLATKDEWEVARLHSGKAFRAELARSFEGDFKLRFHLGAWPFGGTNAAGRPVKGEVGPWMMGVFGILARLRFLRGSLLDPFRNNAARRLDIALLAQFEADIETALTGLDAGTHETAVAIAALPDTIRGFGHVREASARAAAQTRSTLLARLTQPEASAARVA